MFPIVQPNRQKLCIFTASTSATSPFIRTYFKVNQWKNTWQVCTDPASLPSGNANACFWNNAGTSLAVAHDTSPYITIYNRTKNTLLTKISDPASLPAGNAKCCAWNNDGSSLAVCHTTSPFITIYNRSGDTFTKISDPGTLPAGNATWCGWSANGTYLVVAHATSPFVTVYSRSGDTFTKVSDSGTLCSTTPVAGATYASTAYVMADGSSMKKWDFSNTFGYTKTTSSTVNSLAVNQQNGGVIIGTRSDTTVVYWDVIANSNISYTGNLPSGSSERWYKPMFFSSDGTLFKSYTITNGNSMYVVTSYTAFSNTSGDVVVCNNLTNQSASFDNISTNISFGNIYKQA